ncbi:hypothetical protein D3C73_1223380 [compost metagenome]
MGDQLDPVWQSGGLDRGIAHLWRKHGDIRFGGLVNSFAYLRKYSGCPFLYSAAGRNDDHAGRGGCHYEGGA